MLRDLEVGHALPESDRQVHAGGVSDHLHHRSELPIESFDQGRAAFAIERADAPYVPREEPVLDEVREHGLGQARREHVHGLPHRGEAVDQVGRNDEVPEA